MGFEVVEFWDWMRDRLEELDANRSSDDDVDYLGLMPRALEWQKWLLIHALELLVGPGSVFRFRTVLLLVARQNGKSTLLTVLILWRLFQDGARMVLETHASLDHARAAWEEAVAIAEAIPELADDIAKVNEGKSSELLMLDGGERFKIASANRRGGRGFRGDLIIFDELREHQDWRAWSATSKTTMARRRSQVWGVSNAGDASSVVLRHLRKVAIAEIFGHEVEGIPVEVLEDLDINSIGLFEWSAGTVDGTEQGQQRGIWDREGWAEANPSMGYTELDERAIANAAMTDPEWEFRTEVLCQFVNMIGVGPFPNGAWVTTLDTVEARVKRGVARDTARQLEYCVDLSHERTMAYIAVAFWDTEGRRRVEIAAQRAGVDWIIPWLLSPLRTAPVKRIALQSRGAPISSLYGTEDHPGPLRSSGIEVVEWEGPSLAGACGAFYDSIRRAIADDDAQVVITHGNQPALDLAANTAAIKPLGDGWAIDRKASTEDAAPLMAVIGASWLLMSSPLTTRSAYEDRDLMVV